MTEKTLAADGTYTTSGTPHGATSLTPFLAIPDARGAIAFYREIFGARVVDVTNRVVRLQTGYLYHYAFVMLIGVAALVTWMMLGNG